MPRQLALFMPLLAAVLLIFGGIKYHERRQLGVRAHAAAGHAGGSIAKHHVKDGVRATKQHHDGHERHAHHHGASTPAMSARATTKNHSMSSVHNATTMAATAPTTTVVPAGGAATSGSRPSSVDPTKAVWQPDKLAHERLVGCPAKCIDKWRAHAKAERRRLLALYTPCDNGPPGAGMAAAPEADVAHNLVLSSAPPRGGVASAVVRPELFGGNMEITRHNIVGGLSAQVCDLKLSCNPNLQPDPTSDLVLLLRDVLASSLCAQLVANRVFGSHDGRSVPRWDLLGHAALGKMEESVSGAVGSYAVVCPLPPADAARTGVAACGVRQASIGGGWTSVAGQKGSGIPLDRGHVYSGRLVVRTDGEARVSLTLIAETTAQTIVVNRSWRLASFGGEATHHAAEAGAMHAGEAALVHGNVPDVPPAAVRGWRTYDFNFTSPVTCDGAVLTVTALEAHGDKGGAGRRRAAATRVEIGAVSLMRADQEHGMRADVLDALSRIGFRGPFRWPGGCFANIQPDWRHGLKPPDERPPFRAPADGSFCVAAEGGVLAASDGMAIDHPNIDEYLYMMRRIGAEAAISLRLQYGTADELERARQLVEYVNGDAERTRLGRMRARRGHAPPYRVTKFFIGNEAGCQPRFNETRPRSTERETRYDYHASPTATEYAAVLKAAIPILAHAADSARADGALELIATTGSPNITWPRAWFPKAKQPWEHKLGRVPQLLSKWNEPITTAVGEFLYASSYHYYTKAPLVAWDPKRLAEASRLPSELLDALHTARRILDRPRGRKRRMAISLDEWGFGPPWAVVRFGAAHGLYAACALIMLVNHADELGIASANYFQPINEGFVRVHAHNATLTSLGEAVEIVGRHQGQRLLPLPSNGEHEARAAATLPTGVRVRRLPTTSTDDPTATDLWVLASVDDAARRVLVTIINGNAAVSARVRVAIAHATTPRPHSRHAARRMWKATVLRAEGITPGAMVGGKHGTPGWFASERAHAVEEADGYVVVVVPPFSIVQIGQDQ